jgi:hypothetical protein
MTTDNSPQKTLSRMIHNGYNFDNLPQAELDLFMPKIREHKSKCEKCHIFYSKLLEMFA